MESNSVKMISLNSSRNPDIGSDKFIAVTSIVPMYLLLLNQLRNSQRSTCPTRVKLNNKRRHALILLRRAAKQHLDGRTLPLLVSKGVRQKDRASSFGYNIHG